MFERGICFLNFLLFIFVLKDNSENQEKSSCYSETEKLKKIVILIIYW